MIYIVKLTKDNTTFIKLGYTKHSTVSKRFKPYYKFFDEVELLKTYDQQRDLEGLEQYLNRYHLTEHKIDTGFDFGGKTECYSVDSYEFIVEELESSLYQPQFDDNTSCALVNHISTERRMCHGLTLKALRGSKGGDFIDLDNISEDISILRQLFLLNDKLDYKLKGFNRETVFNNCSVWEELLHDTSGRDLEVIDKDEYYELLRIKQEYETYGK